MSYALWKYSCKPNHPVCQAFVLFITPATKATNSAEALVLGQVLAEREGCTYATTDGKLERLGLFVPLTPDVSLANPVILSATGEY